MNTRRLWALGIGSALVAFLFVACGGGATATPVPQSTATQSPTAAATPAPDAATPTPAPTQGRADSTPAASASDGPSATATGFTWQVDTVDDNGAKPSLAVDADGVPHIAYMLEAQPGFVKYAILTADGWDISTVSTGYLYGPLDIQVSNEGIPQISWHSHDEEDAGYAVLVDGQWEVQFIDHPGHDGWDNNLAIDSQGRPHIVSIDPVQFGGQSGVEYATWDGDSWSVEEVGSGPLPYEFGSFIALDSRDRPHVVWFDNDSQDLKYAVKDDGAWQVSTVASEGDVGRYASLAIDSQGNPAISYYESTGQTPGH